MVPRRLALAGLAALIAALALAGSAAASNRRVAISNYQWSDRDLELDRGEHVTWYWIGPDTMHSVTGTSDNAAGIDSDPNIDLPQHKVGDSFRLEFDSPGTYSFHCKLHSTVRGTVTVSDTPGDPSAEPDPVPESRVDLRAPRIRDLALEPPKLHGAGGALRFALDERAKLDADYYRLGRGGRRRFAGWGKWSGYVGLNQVRFAARGSHFSARPGRYVAELRATDQEHNLSEPRLVRFRIIPRG